MNNPRLDIGWDPVKARLNVKKHGFFFTEAATVLLGPLALTVFDATHSRDEERWFTLGSASAGRLLAVAHTYQTLGPDTASARIIPAREATSKERRQYEQNSHSVIAMKDDPRDEMPDEIDFSHGCPRSVLSSEYHVESPGLPG